MKMNNNMMLTALRRPLLLMLVFMALLPARMSAKGDERLFASFANTPNVTLVYISEAALRGGIRIPQNSPIAFSLTGSKLTSFEMVKTQFDGKEKRAIVRRANEIIDHKNFSLLTEVQDGFDSGFTRVYFLPEKGTPNPNIASQIFIFQSSNSFGATLINMTGYLNIAKLFRENTSPGSSQLSFNDFLYGRGSSLAGRLDWYRSEYMD